MLWSKWSVMWLIESSSYCCWVNFLNRYGWQNRWGSVHRYYFYWISCKSHLIDVEPDVQKRSVVRPIPLNAVSMMGKSPNAHVENRAWNSTTIWNRFLGAYDFSYCPINSIESYFSASHCSMELSVVCQFGWAILACHHRHHWQWQHFDRAWNYSVLAFQHLCSMMMPIHLAFEHLMHSFWHVRSKKIAQYSNHGVELHHWLQSFRKLIAFPHSNTRYFEWMSVHIISFVSVKIRVHCQ